MNNSSFRKVVVGDNFENCIRYVKGATYQIGKNRCEITNIIVSETDPNEIEIYASDGDAQFRWKTIAKKTVLEKEEDANFE
tara:strand:+ start:30513 stop:30755 length:243 start_codon:yes stop_codon:yes gene_type:complete